MSSTLSLPSSFWRFMRLSARSLSSFLTSVTLDTCKEPRVNPLVSVSYSAFSLFFGPIPFFSVLFVLSAPVVLNSRSLYKIASSNRVRTFRPVSLLELFPRTHCPYVRNAIHRQNAV